MADGASLDTDVLLKTAAYRIASEVVEVLASKGTPAALGLTHIIAGKQLTRKPGVRDRNGASAELSRLLGKLGRLEPTEDEIAFAASLAAAAQDRELPLDVGEAQLASIVLRRGLPLLVTGDKRAIAALAQLVEGESVRPQLVDRIACFEQVISSVAKLIGEQELRARVCNEPEVDGAISLACSCGREPWDPTQLQEACSSFVGAIRGQVGDLLVGGSSLT